MSPFKKHLYQLSRHSSGRFGLVLILALVSVALMAEFLAPYDPILQDPSSVLLPPSWAEGGSAAHFLGTDVLGRDLMTRLIFGARLSILIGVISVGVGALIGIPMGLVSGYLGGKTDVIIMRIVDVMLAFPSLLLAICIVTILGPSLQNAMIAIGLVGVPNYARVVRASVIGEKSREYVLADVALGRSTLPIIFRGILPNVLGPIFVLATLNFAGSVLEAAGLSFLGLGAQPPTPEWGTLLAEGRNYMHQGWWLMIFPGLAILVTVIGFNLFGDALRDVLDPRAQKKS